MLQYPGLATKVSTKSDQTEGGHMYLLPIYTLGTYRVIWAGYPKVGGNPMRHWHSLMVCPRKGLQLCLLRYSISIVGILFRSVAHRQQNKMKYVE